ncbi:arginine N-methyltransferase 2 [Stipitochalara longipes BDJ]|nr:arginine N-methyltransferase 2 [Stipitochalara longipes BDJ]
MDDPAFSLEEGGSGGVDINTQTILLHASNHDVAALKPLLRIPGNASVQDSETGFTPLHAAIAACGPAKSSSNIPTSDGNASSSPKEGENKDGDEEEEVDIEKAKTTVEELFFSGAIWNDLDKNDETPGCLAWRLGQKELYQMCVNAGVRAEMLLGLMGGYEPLAGEDSEEDEVEPELETTEGENGTNGDTHTEEHELAVGPAEEALEVEKKDVNSEDYLKSELTFTDTALLDEDSNGVMMAWETDIMRKSVDLLLPSLPPGKRILNIGFGMGIIDRMFADTKPATHHIIEAHPAVLAKLQQPDSDFGKAWEESAEEGKYKVHAGKWQTVCTQLLEAGEVYDAIYFDTFGEDYSQLKLFFTEIVPGLLDAEGKFGFFNGLGADRRVCYDVYGKVVELDLCEAGMDVEWTDVEVPVEEMGKEGEGEWKGVRRRYWTLGVYRLPVATFMG